MAVTSSATPNPNALKFTLGRRLIEKGSVTLSSAAAAEAHPWARALFQIPGVASVFALGDFITVTRQPGAEWQTLEPQIVAALEALAP